MDISHECQANPRKHQRARGGFTGRSVSVTTSPAADAAGLYYVKPSPQVSRAIRMMIGIGMPSSHKSIERMIVSPD
ncbi:DUF3383 domain-containing protein [Massilia sp. RP-1-19]|uniref:DUF3383 domain-containing protein n=1 Tax=Massilia polaris TaxID=2728846 RepID=A0A848HT56_9BURK|nr:hypothetical protein [Massilia polaris]NML62911.1 DUF3383 domain-containing protein [Massilia polaris]